MTDITDHHGTLGIVGIGEVGSRIAAAALEHGYSVKAYDVDSDTASLRLASLGIPSGSVVFGEAWLQDCQRVISCVTPEAASLVARLVASKRPSECAYLDINSTDPQDKRAMAAHLANVGVQRFADGAIGGGGFSLPQGPLFYLSGPAAAEWSTVLASLGWSTNVLGATRASIGSAALLKMLRSIFTKGYEGLIVEALLAAEEASLREVVVESIGKSYDGLRFEELAERLVASHVTHAGRRAQEVSKAIATVKEAGYAAELPIADAVVRRFIEDRDAVSRQIVLDPGAITRPLADSLALLGARPGRAGA